MGKGRPTEGNDPLVERAIRLAGVLDRTVATVEEAEKALCLPTPL